MTTLPPFPCSCSVEHSNGLRTDWIFGRLLKDSMCLADPGLSNRIQCEEYHVMNEKESNMYHVILAMLKCVYEECTSEEIDINIDHVLQLKDIDSELENLLQYPTETYLNEKLLAFGQTISYGCTPAAYQGIVVECLILAGKFTALCMEYFGSDQVFEMVNDCLITYFEKGNILSWIKHLSLVMDPFGRLDKGTSSCQ